MLGGDEGLVDGVEVVEAEEVVGDGVGRGLGRVEGGAEECRGLVGLARGHEQAAADAQEPGGGGDELQRLGDSAQRGGQLRQVVGGREVTGLEDEGAGVGGESSFPVAMAFVDGSGVVPEPGIVRAFRQGRVHELARGVGITLPGGGEGGEGEGVWGGGAERRQGVPGVDETPLPVEFSNHLELTRFRSGHARGKESTSSVPWFSTSRAISVETTATEPP